MPRATRESREAGHGVGPSGDQRPGSGLDPAPRAGILSRVAPQRGCGSELGSQFAIHPSPVYHNLCFWICPCAPDQELLPIRKISGRASRKLS